MMTEWMPPSRSAEASAIYAAAEDDRAHRPERYRLGAGEADGLVDIATRGAGVVALGDPAQWWTGLERYLDSAEADGRLNALGAKGVRTTAISRLRARISSAAHRTDAPGVERRDLAPPIVILGGWRTGTTFLYRLLAGDPRLRAPLPAELIAPWRFDECDDDTREQMLDADGTRHQMLHLLNPVMAAVHESGARLPEECVLTMGMTLRNWAFTSTTRLDGYADWLAGEDFASEYAAHRQTLQMLDRADGRRWVLKAPAHTAELPHLAATYPGAVLINLHRDIVETVASGTSLFATYRSTYSDHVDPRDVGRFQTDQTELWLRRAIEFRESSAADSVTLVDVAYPDLVADPAAVLRRIYSAADLDEPDVVEMMERHRTDQPRHGRGKHSYRPEEFGIDPPVLRERFAFYTDRYPLIE